MATNDRTERSPQDPNWRWQGPNTDITHRPTPNELDKIRRTAKAQNASITGAVEFAVSQNCNDAAVLVHDLGLANHAPSYAFIRRIIALEAQNFLLEASINTLRERLDRIENKL